MVLIFPRGFKPLRRCAILNLAGLFVALVATFTSGSNIAAAGGPGDGVCFQIPVDEYHGDPNVVPGFDRSFHFQGPNLGWSYRSPISGNVAYSAWGPWESGKKRFVEADRLAADLLPGPGANGRGGWTVLGAHGQYGEDFYNHAFEGRDFSGTKRIAAASCNEEFGLYSPIEKVARKNPGRYVYGIRPDATDVSWNMPVKDGDGLKLHFDTIPGGQGTGVVPENVLAVGKYDPSKEAFYWRPLPDSKVRDWLARRGIDYEINPAAMGNSSMARSLGNALGAGKQIGKGLSLNLILPEGAEVPTGLVGTSSLMTANLYGGQAVLAAESLTGMSAGVSYSAGGAMTLGGAFTLAVGGVAFAGSGLYQTVRQSPQMGYVPENGYSTGYFDNFAEMYCFWCN